MLYVEGGSDGERLVDGVARRARAGKPVIVLTGGLSDQGPRPRCRTRARSRATGECGARSPRATGAAVVERLEDFLGALVFAQRYADHPGLG